MYPIPYPVYLSSTNMHTLRSQRWMAASVAFQPEELIQWIKSGYVPAHIVTHTMCLVPGFLVRCKKLVAWYTARRPTTWTYRWKMKHLQLCLWLQLYIHYHRTTALNNCEHGGWGWDRLAIMMISQCYKTKNPALNQQTLRESISLFQLNKITFLDLSNRRWTFIC